MGADPTRTIPAGRQLHPGTALPGWLRLLTALLVVAAAGCAWVGDGEPSPSAPEQTATTGPARPPRSPPVPPERSHFAGAVAEVDDSIEARMASSWRPGCPVPLSELRLVTLRHWDFGGAVREGEIVVHKDHAADVLSVFEALFDARFPIAQVRLVDEFGGDDDRSMAANNTSGFNCRVSTSSDRWSEHAYGRAIDINPVQNPFVLGTGEVLPPAGHGYTDRTTAAPGVITPDGPVVAAFQSVGWIWGGTWRFAKDYQHFSTTGR